MSPVPSPRQKTPAGRVDSSVSPAARESAIQFETSPPATRFTVTCSSSSTSGEEDIEYERSTRRLADGQPERQELPGSIGKCGREVGRDVEHERHRFSGFRD